MKIVRKKTLIISRIKPHPLFRELEFAVIRFVDKIWRLENPLRETHPSPSICSALEFLFTKRGEANLHALIQAKRPQKTKDIPWDICP